jgi:putative membrane protein
VIDLHTDPGTGALHWLPTLPALLGVAVYLGLVIRSTRPWPAGRTLCWLLGTLAALAATTGELAEAAEGDFVAHMITHLLLGMLAPLLLVLAAPVTLLLRTLPTGSARRVSHVLTSLPVRVLTEPVVAAVLSVGGLWLLYTTALYPAMHHSSTLHLIIHLHVLIAGYLFTVAMISVDPLPHRRSYLHRGIVLAAALAAHDVLAKHLYVHPPAGVSASTSESAAMVMYYGGDLVDLVIMVILCLCWYRATGRRLPARTPGATSRRVRCSASAT